MRLAAGTKCRVCPQAFHVGSGKDVGMQSDVWYFVSIQELTELLQLLTEQTEQGAVI